MHCVLFIALFIGLTTYASASDVLVFTDSDFETKVKQYDVLLAEFYAPWCGHCKRLAPEYEKAATVLVKSDPPVALVKVDCTVETKICGKYGVSGYPTLKIFKNGEFAEDYNGPREFDGIVSTMRSKAGPSYRVLDSLADYEKFLEHNDHSIIGYFDSDTHALKNDLVKVADQLSEKFRFAYTTAKEVLDKAGHLNKVVVHQPKRLQSKFEDAFAVVEGAADKIKSYIQQKIHGLVGHRTPSNIGDYSKPNVVIYYNVDYVRDTKGTNYIRNRILKIAKKLADENVNVRFAVSNAEEFRHELTEFGIDDVKKDGKYVLARGSADQKYKMLDEFSFEALEDFARKVVNGLLEPYLKSQPIPEQTGDVKVVVAKNFDDIVNDDSKDVLIEFYAPWCGHCKSLAPKYDELAKKLKKESSIVIAKMDATENDVPSQYQVQGFPTIYFAPKNNKENPQKYEGGREVDDFIKYLAKEATEPLDGYDRNGSKKKKGAKAVDDEL
jgi:protein disulfide isomerase family A protein 3